MEKISLNIVKFLPIITIFTILFVISGYIYNYLYLGYYGINVAFYFSLNDYFAASLQILPESIMIVGFLIGFYIVIKSCEKILNRTSYKDLPSLINARSEFIFALFCQIAIAYSVVISGFEKGYIGLTISMAFYAIYCSRIIADVYFTGDSKISVYMIVFSILFLISLLYVIVYQILHIDDELEKHAHKKTYIFKENVPFKNNKLFLLGANSNYYFFIDKDKASYVIPKSEIRYIKIN